MGTNLSTFINLEVSSILFDLLFVVRIADELCYMYRGALKQSFKLFEKGIGALWVVKSHGCGD